MKKYIIICLLFYGSVLFSQPTHDIIKKATFHFSMDSIGNLSGNGGDFIKNKISEAQFFLIGEQHNIRAIETLVNSLIPFFKESGYHYYLTEIGPVSANKLMEIRDRSSLKNLYLKYSSQTNLSPFGFFSTVEEIKTLHQLQKYDITLCGIDFENYASYLFLIDELYKNSDKGKISKNLYEKIYAFLKSEYGNGKNNFNPDLMNNLQHSKELTEFLSLANNKINAPVIE